MKKISAYINIVRPVNFLITFCTVIVAAALSYKGEYSSVKVLLAAITASLTMSAGNIINDIYDLNGDKVNHPGRPLPSGIISLKSAFMYYFILLTVSLILSLYISNLNFAVNLLAILLLYLYSYKQKRIAFGGNLVVSLLTGLVFIYGGIVVNSFYHLSCWSAVTGRRTPSCWCSGTRTRCCAGTPAGYDTNPPTGSGSPCLPGSSRAGAGRRSSP